MSKEKFDIKEAITNEIIQSLEETQSVWHKDWKCMGVPMSLSSKDYAYKGINFLILSLKQIAKGYTSSKWVTFKQCVKLGGEITKGEKSTMVTYYQRIEIVDKETQEKKTIPFLKYYNVFNIEQTSLKDREEYKEQDLNELDSTLINNEIELLINNYDCGIQHIVQDRACYIPSLDKINMPVKEQFTNYHAYYATLLHEITHSTGHEKRLDRFNETKKIFKNSKEDYAFEELVAELTSMFLLATYKVDNESIKDNNKAYIKGWLKALKSDKEYIFKASKYAQKAFEYVLNNKENSKEENRELATTI